MIHSRGTWQKATVPLSFIGESVEQAIFHKFAFSKINY